MLFSYRVAGSGEFAITVCLTTTPCPSGTSGGAFLGTLMLLMRDTMADSCSSKVRDLAGGVKEFSALCVAMELSAPTLGRLPTPKAASALSLGPLGDTHTLADHWWSTDYSVRTSVLDQASPPPTTIPVLGCSQASGLQL